MLTMHKEEDLCNRALDNGAMGFVLKENAVEEIVKAVAAVAEGEHFLSSSVSGYLVRRRHRAEQLAKEKPGLDDLTKAELRILKLISQKKTSREIGAELFISPRTVEAHRANICSKLKLSGSHSLLYFALSHKSELVGNGLISLGVLWLKSNLYILTLSSKVCLQRDAIYPATRFVSPTMSRSM